MRRRRVLELAGVIGVSALAGCSGGENAGNARAGGSGGETKTTTEKTTPTTGALTATATSGGTESDSGSESRGCRCQEVAYGSVDVNFDFDSPTTAVVHFGLPAPTQCGISYGEGLDYGTLRGEEAAEPTKDHHIPITTAPGTQYDAKLDVFDTDLNALQLPNITFEAPDSGSATASTNHQVNYIETPLAESQFTASPSLDIGKTTVSLSYRTKTPTLGIVGVQQNGDSMVRRHATHEPRTNHDLTIDGLKRDTRTQWAVGLVAPNSLMYTTRTTTFRTE